MSAHTINRPVPRVLAMAVSLASRAFNTARTSEASEEIGCLGLQALAKSGQGTAMEPGDRGRDPAACGARQGFGPVAGGRLGRDLGVVARHFGGPGCAAEAVA